MQVVVDFVKFLLSKAVEGIITGATAAFVGIGVYYWMYYQKSFREDLKKLILEYVERANGKKEGSCYRNGVPIYPTTKAIMQYCRANDKVPKRIRMGGKYDEDYFEALLNELRMEGRISPVQCDKTDEIIGWEFSHHDI